eukprot:1985396-Ditylum_brightwellii.AAC.1
MSARVSGACNTYTSTRDQGNNGGTRSTLKNNTDVCQQKQGLLYSIIKTKRKKQQRRKQTQVSKIKCQTTLSKYYNDLDATPFCDGNAPQPLPSKDCPGADNL